MRRSVSKKLSAEGQGARIGIQISPMDGMADSLPDAKPKKFASPPGHGTSRPETVQCLFGRDLLTPLPTPRTEPFVPLIGKLLGIV